MVGDDSSSPRLLSLSARVSDPSDSSEIAKLPSESLRCFCWVGRLALVHLDYYGYHDLRDVDLEV